MAGTRPSPTGGASAYNQSLQPYQGNMFGQSLQLINNDQQRRAQQVINSDTNQLELQKALISGAPTLNTASSNATKLFGSVMQQGGMNPQFGLIQPAVRSNAYTQGIKANVALTEGQAAEKGAAGGSFMKETPRFSAGDPRALALIKMAGAKKSKGGGLQQSVKQQFGTDGSVVSGYELNTKGTPDEIATFMQQNPGAATPASVPAPIPEANPAQITRGTLGNPQQDAALLQQFIGDNGDQIVPESAMIVNHPSYGLVIQAATTAGDTTYYQIPQ